MKFLTGSTRLVVVALLLLVTLLAACGENTATTVPAPTTAAAAATTSAAVTTAAATSAAATTAAATSAAATTPAATTTAVTTAASDTTAAATTASDTSAASGTTAAATTAASGTTTTAAAATGTSEIPVYNGATLITLPEAIQTQLVSNFGSAVKNAKLEAYKVADDDSKIKDFFTTNLPKDGWLDITSQLPASATSAFSSAGLTAVGPFVKAPQVAFILLGKGSSTLFSSLPGVSATDSVYLVFAGNA